MSEKKESPWRWLIVAGSFVVHFVVCGLSYSCGVFHIYFLHHYGKSHFQTTWISGLLLSMTALGGIPGYMLTYQFGYRATVVLGGALSALGLGLSAFAEQMFEMYLTVGALTGLGLGIALTPSIMVVENYFGEHRAVPSSIAISGLSIGLFLFPVLIFKLEDVFAWKGMSLILAGICLNVCLAGALMRENKAMERRKDLLKMFEPSLCKSSAFMCTLISNFIWSFGISIIYTHLPSAAMDTGLTLEDGVTLVAITGVTGFASRSMFLVFHHSARLDHVSTFICTVVLSAILCGLFTELFQHKAGEIGYAIMLGLHTGYWSTYVSSVVSELIGEEYIAFGKGYVSLSVGLGLLGGPPISGWIFDDQGEFDISFYLAGACLLVSSGIMMGVNLKRCHYRPSTDWIDTDSEISGVSGLSGNAAVATKLHELEERQMLVTHMSAV